MNIRTLRTLALIWIAWVVILIGYMHFAPIRYAPARSDDALVWTANETRRDSNEGKIYLLEPFLNTQVAWDSEFYLSVATFGGYDDPAIRLVTPQRGGDTPAYSMSYAFFPFYPLMMRVVRAPFPLFGLNDIAASALAGVIVSVVGTLIAMIALYDLVRDELGDDGAIRTGFYLLIFPAGFFFAVVYTEGLFVALAFGSLALMNRRRLIPAAILAVLAVWTRSVGGALVIPLLITWAYQMWKQPEARRGLLLRLPLLFLPIAAYFVWRAAYGVPFDFVNANWFGNALFDFANSRLAWEQFLARAAETPETSAYAAMSIGAMAIAAVSCLLTIRRYPAAAIFGLIAILIPLTSGWTATNSAFRYALVVPTLPIMLARWGKHAAFDRAWTLFSILLLAMNAFLFAFDFWAG